MGTIDVMNFDVRSLFGGSSKPPAPNPSSGIDVMTFDPRSLTGTQDIKGIISVAAQRHGVPADLLHKMAGSESSYDPNVTNKTGSSAKGLFQFIDSTWQAMGGKPGEQYIPEKNADLGAKYVRQNIETLHDKLGRNPTYGEVYAAHYFGPGVVSMIQRANPNAPIEQGLSTFHDRDGVRKVMQQNPNLHGKTVRQVMDSLNQKVGDKVVGGSYGQRAEADTNDDTPESQQTMVADNGDNYEDAWNSDDYANNQAA